MEDLFTFFFKYPPLFFRKGDFFFQGGFASWWFALLAVALLVAVFVTYGRKWLQMKGRARFCLIVLRGSVFLILLVLLMRPCLRLSTLVPKETVLALLVDNSQSMGILDDGVARGQKLLELLTQEPEFAAALEEKFYLHTFRFAARAERQEPVLQLNWHGNQTNIAAGLEAVLAETKNLPLGAILLFSDGSDNSFGNLRDVLTELKLRKIPVHTIGVGPESLSRDIEMTQLNVPRLLIPESVAVARVIFRHRGFGGRRSRLEVRENSSLVQAKEVYFPRDSETVSVDLKLIPKSEGIKTYTFTLIPLENEQIRENNVRLAIVRVRNAQPRILYVEGRPRWEYKFLRRALSDDKHVRLETLLRTALNKFYRQGIEDESTLAAGFPSKREALFAYHGIILGSVESSFFTYPQMEMVRDFVGKRGGGFLMLGGSSSFAAGGYQNTPIEEILPVWLQDASDSGGTFAGRYAQGDGKFHLSDYGRSHPALQLSLEDQENRRRWPQMPALKDWNRVASTKSGATVLANGDFAGHGNTPLFIFHRYGRGQSLALLTGSSWRWQMLQHHQDQSHETFWRQILRWLVSSAKDPVAVETEREVYSRSESVRIRAEVNDGSFNRINDARVEAIVTSPEGEVSQLALHWDTREDGVYRGQWSPERDGLYQIRVEAFPKEVSQSQSYGQATVSFLCSSGRREYFDSVQKKNFLQELARETGGSYYTLSNVRRLPKEILYTPSGSPVVETLDLWDMPINLMVLLALLVAEWLLRRQYGRV